LTETSTERKTDKQTEYEANTQRSYSRNGIATLCSHMLNGYRKLLSRARACALQQFIGAPAVPADGIAT